MYLIMTGDPFDDGSHKLEQFWKHHEEKVDDTEQLKQKLRMHLETFLAIEVMGWRDDGYGWFDTDCGICLYARGQNSRFSENWVPYIILDQAMLIWNKMNLAASITFDPSEDEDSNIRWVIELKVDHSTGWGNTLQEAICSVVGARYGWRYKDD